MKYLNIQRVWSNPVYARFQKHFCPSCGEQMGVAKRDAILTAEQAVSRGFHPDATGKTKYVWDVLECPGCGRSLTIPEMTKLEKERC